MGGWLPLGRLLALGKPVLPLSSRPLFSSYLSRGLSLELRSGFRASYQFVCCGFYMSHCDLYHEGVSLGIFRTCVSQASKIPRT